MIRRWIIEMNYNLIKIIIQYLITLCTYYEKENYLTVKSSFDTIIEFIQGPCIENQITIIKSKLLFTLKDIFNIYIGKYLSESANKIASKISFNQLGLIVEKATILLLAVIEGRTKDDPIYEEIRKCIGVDTIENTQIMVNTVTRTVIGTPSPRNHSLLPVRKVSM